MIKMENEPLNHSQCSKQHIKIMHDSHRKTYYYCEECGKSWYPEPIFTKLNDKINIVWICSYGEIRSVTGKNMYGGVSFGLHDRYFTNPRKQRVNRIEEACKTADVIYLFDDYDGCNSKTFKKVLPQFVDKLIVFDIPDNYGEVNHPKLIERIKEEIEK